MLSVHNNRTTTAHCETVGRLQLLQLCVVVDSIERYRHNEIDVVSAADDVDD